MYIFSFWQVDLFHFREYDILFCALKKLTWLHIAYSRSNFASGFAISEEGGGHFMDIRVKEEEYKKILKDF